MSTPLILLALLVAFAGGVIADLRRHPRQARSPESGGPLPLLAGRVARVRIAAAGLAMVCSFLVAGWGSLGRGILLAPAVFGVVLIASIALSEHFLARVVPEEACALVEVRRADDYLAPAARRVLLASAVTLGVLLLATSLVAVPDDMGRAGRGLAWTCGRFATGAVTPFPGTFYAVPAALALVVVMASWATATMVLRGRRRVVAAGAGARADDELRARSMSAITAAATVAVSGMLAGTAAVTGLALRNAAGSGSCAAPWAYAVTGWAAIALAAAAGILNGFALTRLLIPRAEHAPAVAALPRTARLR